MAPALTSYQFHVSRLIGISGSGVVGVHKTWGREDFAALFELFEGLGRTVLYGDPSVGDNGRHFG